VRVGALYSQSKTLLSVSPTQLSLKHKAETSELTADCLFASAAVLGIASVWLALLTEWHGDSSPEIEGLDPRHMQFVPVATPQGAGILFTGSLP
jgi:hypothetical protein